MPPSSEGEAQALLATATPDQIDQALQAWLPPSIASAIEPIWHTRPGPDPEIWDDAYIANYRLADGLKADADAARSALALLELLDVHAERREYAKAVGRLKVLTISRAPTAEDLALQIDSLATEMTEYPIDVARGACKAWARAEKFFPAWAELRALCEERVMLRRSLARALRAYIELVEQRETETKALPPKEPPAVTVWREHEAELKAAFEAREWDAWIVRSIPHRDDGETLTLAVPTRFIKDWINSRYAAKLGAIIGRRVVCEVHNWVGAALDDRDRRAAAKSAQKVGEVVA